MQLRPSRASSAGRGFTLIELLVVISIIAILASLALPALNGAMTAAKKAQANAMVSQLKVAVTGYNTEYGTWPINGTADGNMDSTKVYTVLTGTEGASAVYNTRNIAFMEFTTKDLDNPTSTTPNVVDPWYKTTQNLKQTYTIVLDGNFDNQIPVPNTGATTGNININAGVGVYDPGPPSKGKTLNTDQTKYLHSW